MYEPQIVWVAYWKNNRLEILLLIQKMPLEVPFNHKLFTSRKGHTYIDKPLSNQQQMQEEILISSHRMYTESKWLAQVAIDRMHDNQ